MSSIDPNAPEAPNKFHPRESAYAFKQLMQAAQDEIDSGARQGARRIWKTANRARTHISWMKRRLLLGEFRKRA